LMIARSFVHGMVFWIEFLYTEKGSEDDGI